MRVLVTRPVHDAARTATRLAELGHQALFAPILAIVPTQARVPDGPFDAIIATSANAFAYLGPDEPPSVLLALPVLTVGAHTAAAARARGFYTIRPAAPDAAALLAAIRATLDDASRLLYLAGADRKPQLEAGLRAAGQGVAVVETYAAHASSALPPAVCEALAQGKLDAVLHFSPRSATHFCRLVAAGDLVEAAARLSHHCISAETARPLAELGAARVILAARPDETALLATLPPRGRARGA